MLVGLAIWSVATFLAGLKSGIPRSVLFKIQQNLKQIGNLLAEIAEGTRQYASSLQTPSKPSWMFNFLAAFEKMAQTTEDVQLQFRLILECCWAFCAILSSMLHA